MNPNDEGDLQKLYNAISWSRRQMKDYRKNRVDTIKEYVGLHYSEGGTDDRRPVNMMETAVNLYMYMLAASSPRAMVSTAATALKPNAESLKIALNNTIKKIRIVDTLRMAVKEALFSIGIVKIGLEAGQLIEAGGERHDVGKPFVDNVSLDDWVHDMTSMRLDQCEYMGNRYRLPLEAVKEDPWYEDTDDLSPTDLRDVLDGLDDPDERDRDVGNTESHAAVEMRDHIELQDIWIPSENLLLTCVAEHPKVLHVTEWDGPEHGPYRWLSFYDVPGNTMPLPPVAVWADLNDFLNRVFIKICRQAERQKTVTVAERGAETEAERVRGANDGAIISVDNINRISEHRFGGADGQSLAVFMQAHDLFNSVAGNLDLLGGLSAGSETATQDVLLARRAGQRIEYMADRTTDFTRGIMRDLAYYIWNDPLSEYEVTKRVRGTSIEVQSAFGPDMRTDDLILFNIDIEPYSLQAQSPGSKLQNIMGIWNQFLMPYQQMMAAQGITPDFDKVINLIAELSNTPEINDILIYAQPQTGPVEGSAPRATHRTYERVNRPGASRKAKEQAISQMLMGVAKQPAEAAQAGRAVS